MLDKKIRKNSVCKRLEDEDGNKTAVLATDSNVYKAELKDPAKEFMNTFIMAHNKRTKEIKLFQVNQATFSHTIYENRRSMFEQNVVDANKVLHKEFSGKRGANAYERKARSVANTSLLETTIENTMESLDTDALFAKDIFDKTQEERDEFANSIFPQIENFSVAKNVRDLFDINSLVGRDMVEHLAEITVGVLNTASLTWPFKNNYIRTMFQVVQSSKAPDSSENIRKCSMMIYADALSNIMTNRKVRDLNPNSVSPFSHRLGKDVIDKFTGDSNKASKFSKQKAIIYYTILMLLSTDKLQLPFEDLLNNVSVSKTELMKYAQIIGCNAKGNRLCFSKANVNSNAKFSVPLFTGAKKRRST